MKRIKNIFCGIGIIMMIPLCLTGIDAIITAIKHRKWRKSWDKEKC